MCKWPLPQPVWNLMALTSINVVPYLNLCGTLHQSSEPYMRPSPWLVWNPYHQSQVTTVHNVCEAIYAALTTALTSVGVEPNLCGIPEGI